MHIFIGKETIMNINTLCEQLFQRHKILPVVTIVDIDKATQLAMALLKGGISIMEVTLRTPNALSIIEKISHDIPEMVVGAGTVINEDLYHKSIKHGAKFIVSPGLTESIAKVANDYPVPFIPGAITPSEVMKAIEFGFNHLKFFPAESYNGTKTLKSMVNVFPNVKFCPTGGIGLDNAMEYFDLPNVIGIGVSSMVNKDLIENNKFEKITELAQKFIKLHISN